jgi:hypothetical protein
MPKDTEMKLVGKKKNMEVSLKENNKCEMRAKKMD